MAHQKDEWRQHAEVWLKRYDNGNGETMREIAATSGFSIGTVRKALKESGAEIPQRRGRAASTRGSRSSDAGARQATMTEVAWAVLHALKAQKKRLRIRDIREYVIAPANSILSGARTLESRGYAEKSIIDHVGWYSITTAGREAVRTESPPDIYRPVKRHRFHASRSSWDDRRRNADDQSAR